MINWHQRLYAGPSRRLSSRLLAACYIYDTTGLQRLRASSWFKGKRMGEGGEGGVVEEVKSGWGGGDTGELSQTMSLSRLMQLGINNLRVA